MCVFAVNVCALACDTVYVFVCVAVTVIAPGLINILVSREDIGAYSQKAKGGEGGFQRGELNVLG